MADYPHVDPRPHALADQREHLGIAQLRVIDEQLVAGGPDESRQSITRVQRADQQIGDRRLVRLASCVGLEQRQQFLDDPPRPHLDAEAPALIDVERGEVERENEGPDAVDYEELGVVADEVVGGAGRL